MITSQQIKNNTILSADIKDGTLAFGDLDKKLKSSVAAIEVVVSGRVSVDAAGAASIAAPPTSFNNLGGQVSVSNPAAGTYDVNIPGLKPVYNATLTVVSGAAFRFATAEIAGTRLRIRTFDQTGALLNLPASTSLTFIMT